MKKLKASGLLAFSVKEHNLKAVVFNLGCKVNECESQSLMTGLENLGYLVSDMLEYADLYIVNTCAVTKEAEKKSRQVASRIKKFNKNAKIIFMGCASQKNPSAFLNKGEGCLVTGVFGKGRIPEILHLSGEMIEKESNIYDELPFPKNTRTRAFVKVQDGCDNFCAYCIIPYLRGRSRSREIESIVAEIKALNSREVVITGINLSAYNVGGLGLTGLILALKDVDKRIRLGSLETNVITREFLTALKGLKDFAPHFHLSLQSGSNAVLKKMNRKYSREEYLSRANLIREYFPNAGITTDIIVGFPTETEQDFLDTVDLVNKVKFSDVHVFPFSSREGTVAYKMPDLSPEIKKDRLDKLLKIKEQYKTDFALFNQGETLSVLLEEEKDGYKVGYSENYLRTYVKCDKIGEIVKVKILRPFRDGAEGVIV